MSATALRRELLRVVESQLQRDDPPEVRATLERLVRDGWSQREAKRLISLALGHETYAIVGLQRAFDAGKYAQALRALPRLPRAAL